MSDADIAFGAIIAFTIVVLIGAIVIATSPPLVYYDKYVNYTNNAYVCLTASRTTDVVVRTVIVDAYGDIREESFNIEIAKPTCIHILAGENESIVDVEIVPVPGEEVSVEEVENSIDVPQLEVIKIPS